jgi:hypothetical protein
MTALSSSPQCGRLVVRAAGALEPARRQPAGDRAGHPAAQVHRSPGAAVAGWRERRTIDLAVSAIRRVELVQPGNPILVATLR